MLTDGQLTRWSLDYKQCINSPDVRESIVGRPLSYLAVSQQVNAPAIVEWITGAEQRGTIEFVFTSRTSAHYVSFFPGDDGETVVFDPSFSARVTGGFPLDPWMRSALNTIFPRWRLFRNVRPLQLWNYEINKSDDTWCQSWSLAMLHPYLQSRVQGWAEQRGANLYSRRANAADLVVYFARGLTKDHFAMSLHARDVERAWLRHRRVLDHYDLRQVFWRFYADENARTPVTPLRPRHPDMYRADPPMPRQLFPP